MSKVMRKRRMKRLQPARSTRTARRAHKPLRAADTIFTRLLAELVSGALRLAASATGVPLHMAEALLLTPGQLRALEPEQRRMMRETGLYVRELRELAGLTLSDLGDALNLQQRSLLQAVEKGTATLSFELILRLAAVLARHDPIPFVLHFVRTYNPEVWKFLDEWGVARLPLQFEREREFVNVYRRHDTARKLSDDGFAEVLKFTSAAFDLALHFVAEREGLDELAHAARPIQSA